MKFKSLTGFAFFLVLVLLANLSFAKEKERQWQTGKVLDTGRDRTYAGIVDDASGTANDLRQHNIRERKRNFDSRVSSL
jgi:hypothetical protein